MELTRVPDLETRFKAFLERLPFSENIDELITEDQARLKHADYFLDNRRIVLELKALSIETEHKLQAKIQEVMDRPDAPIVFGRVPLEAILKKMPEGEKITRSILDVITRPIISHFEKADKQICQTKESFSLPASCGVLLLLNDSVVSMDPKNMLAQCNRMILKKIDGELRYKDIAFVLIFNEAHYLPSANQKQGAFLMFQLEGPTANQFESARNYLSNLTKLWTQSQGTPHFEADSLSGVELVSKAKFKRLKGPRRFSFDVNSQNQLLNFSLGEDEE